MAFVGRQRELAELTGELEEAMSGKGRLVLLTGEAGVGKTALSRELLRHADHRGLLTASARGWDAMGAPAFFPFIQVFRALLRDHEELTRRALERVPGRAAMIAPLAPDLVLGETPRPGERFALFDAAAGWLRDLAKERPLAILLDDLQAADPSSLSMLQYIAHELASAKVLLLGVHRDRNHGATSDVLDQLARLARDASLLHLGRLPKDAVLEMMTWKHGGVAPPALVDLVYRTSEGVPLFVDEILRAMTKPGSALVSGAPLPSGVRGALRERFSQLDHATTTQLEIASVVGTTFTLALIGRLTPDVELAKVHELVERAANADVLDRLAPGRYAFAHAMLREALYRDIPGARRAALHAAVVTTFESGAVEGTTMDLAHHALKAAPVIGIERAVATAKAAADAAMAVHAFEDAAELLQRALAVLDLGAAPSASRSSVESALAAARAFEGAAMAPGAKSKPAEPKVAEIAHEGELYSVRLGDEVVRLKDSRGLQMLATLVATPGTEIHCVPLSSGGIAQSGGELVTDLPPSDAGEVLDREAIEAYRERLIECEDELREAEAWGDAGRLERARTEMEFLRAELKSAVGLGGRVRRVGSDAERARVNVQRRIKDAIRRIAEQSSRLGAHLERSVRTGTFCSYEPGAG